MGSNPTVPAIIIDLPTKNFMYFKIDPAYLCSITVRQDWSVYRGKVDLTDDDLIKILKGEDRCYSIGTDDHDEFKNLRQRLGSEGYISIDRSCWNGDRVLKQFYLNGKLFKVHHRFPCGAAMSAELKFKK